MEMKVILGLMFTAAGLVGLLMSFNILGMIGVIPFIVISIVSLTMGIIFASHRKRD